MSKQSDAVRAGEPIAIVGMACRFPGASDISSFWRLLEAGEHAITQGVPGSGVGRIGELFPDAAVQSEACRFGAFVADIDLFDAAFFRISPVEAALLDPQQRMMLETSWQALEDAGVDPERLKGTRTGVYAGISNNEYRGLILGASETAEPATSLYTVTGTSFNTAIGRVAFALGLEGPAMAVDTACSSSLVAIHQAPVCKRGLNYEEFDAAADRVAGMTRHRTPRFESEQQFAELLPYLPIYQRAVPGVHELVARTTLRESADGNGYELRCPRDYEAQIIQYAAPFAVMVELDKLRCPTKVIGADPTLPYSYLPTLDLSHILTPDYDFVPETTHFPQLEQPERCVEIMRDFLDRHGLLSS